MAGLVLSSTLLGQLLFFEITGGCSWALISYYQSDKAQRSALKALLITHIGSLGLYLAAATLFLQTGTFALSAMSELHGDARYLVYGGILFAAWGKSAQLPMQAWLPDAMEAPTPISAYLHAASMVKVGVYIFARAIIDGGNIPHVIGGVGMVMAPGHHSLWISDVFATAGYEAVAGLVDHHSTWLDVLRLVALHLRLAAGAGG